MIARVTDAAALLEAADLFDAPPSPESARAYLADDRNVLYVAYDGGDPVGFARGVLLTRPEDVRPQMFLYEIGVEPPAQRRGLGRALIEAMKEECARVGAFEMFVLTNRSNDAAMALYTATGAASDAGDDEVSLVWTF